MPKVIIEAISCTKVSDSGSEDEIFLVEAGTGKIWPEGNYRNIGEGQTIEVGIARSYSGNRTYELWEYDDAANPNDLLGSFAVNDSSRGTFFLEANGDGNQLLLRYSVVD